MEGGVKGALFEEKHRLAGSLDPFIDRVPVQRPPGEGFQHEKIEAAAEKIGLGVGHCTLCDTRERINVG
jgi:hypothetical protein